ncbi:MAG: hypothetical protein J0H49_34175 [Acidobacteria bacterium]|nr:hypothetical protein [Acidobacteriota bacterium]
MAHQAGLAIENAQLTNKVAEKAVQRRELKIAKDVQAPPQHDDITLVVLRVEGEAAAGAQQG